MKTKPKLSVVPPKHFGRGFRSHRRKWKERKGADK